MRWRRGPRTAAEAIAFGLRDERFGSAPSMRTIMHPLFDDALYSSMSEQRSPSNDVMRPPVRNRAHVPNERRRAASGVEQVCMLLLGTVRSRWTQRRAHVLSMVAAMHVSVFAQGCRAEQSSQPRVSSVPVTTPSEDGREDARGTRDPEDPTTPPSEVGEASAAAEPASEAPVNGAAPEDASPPEPRVVEAEVSTAAPEGERSSERTAAGRAPRCRSVGTRSENWSWPDGRRIRWAKCKGQQARCRHAGTPEEGWYAGSELIVKGPCGG